MRYSTMPAWIYVVPIGFGVAFVIGAVVFIFAGPQPGAKQIGAIWLVMDAIFVVVCVRALRGRKDEERIRRDGVPATATLLGAKTTGSFINGVPQWNFRLRVDGNGPAYETALKVLTFNPPENGAAFAVRADARRKDIVVLAGDDGELRTTPPADAAAAVAAAPAADAGGMRSTLNADGSRTFWSS
jgi:hypothetical protein